MWHRTYRAHGRINTYMSSPCHTYQLHHCSDGMAHTASAKWHLSDTWWLFRYAYPWWLGSFMCVLKVNTKIWASRLAWFCRVFWVQRVANHFWRSPQAAWGKSRFLIKEWPGGTVMNRMLREYYKDNSSDAWIEKVQELESVSKTPWNVWFSSGNAYS